VSRSLKRKKKIVDDDLPRIAEAFREFRKKHKEPGPSVSNRRSLKCQQSEVTIFVKNLHEEALMAQKVDGKKNAGRWSRRSVMVSPNAR